MGETMPKKEIIQVNLAAPNPNLSPATRFGKLYCVQFQLPSCSLTSGIFSIRQEP
jgi:hypothetical protein